MTLSDYRRAVDQGQSVAYFSQVVSASEYYPFGMLLTEGNYSSGSYRFGFQGQEMDNELKGTGNSYDFGARIYDPRVGRFMSLDPDASKYPFMTPYCFAANKPISLIDVNGKGPFPSSTHLFNVYEVFENALKNNKRDNGFQDFNISVKGYYIDSPSSNRETNLNIEGFKYHDSWYSSLGSNEYSGKIKITLTNGVKIKANLWLNYVEDESQNQITKVDYLGNTSAPATGEHGYYIVFRSSKNRMLGILRFDTKEDYTKYLNYLEKFYREGELEAAEEIDNDNNSSFYQNWFKKNRPNPEEMPEVKEIIDTNTNKKRTNNKDGKKEKKGNG